MIGLFKTAPGKGNMEIRTADIPEPGQNEVRIRVHAAGICGSDIHIYNWATQVAMNPPVIMGHEFSGEIDKLGEKVAGWSAGDRVTGEPSYSVCGQCMHCNSGFYNLCPERKVLGFWTDGAFAEYIVVPAFRLHRLPEVMSFSEGALTEPFACCVHAVSELTGIDPNDTVLVSGPGAIGLLALQVVKAHGAKAIVAGTSVDEQRLKTAKELGADIIVNAETDDIAEIVAELTGGFGADTVIECSGSQPAAAFGIDIIRKRGKYTQVGLFGKPITLDFEKIAYKEIRVTGSFAQKWSAWKKALSLFEQGKVKLKPLISRELPLDDWEEGFQQLAKKDGLKIVLKP